ncbi:hypothetical protein KIM372_11890 [Bombiscardovia nodaiensis]|uniref:LysM domain-containing protein n=1 Tax=Bombiscardovia nodaiensis TaxID=2932181 RepID=A0ABN6SDV4_9BIFI|nr:hypothetical protein KIM372_11890 [Bombiscardovia nodaiensis]
MSASVSMPVSSKQFAMGARSGKRGSRGQGATPASASGRLVLTVKGKVTAMVLAGCLLVAGAGLVMSDQARSDTGVQEVTSYIVQPGDTLWTYASMVTPQGGDVSRGVDQLMELNSLNSPSLQVGQRIIVPKQ